MTDVGRKQDEMLTVFSLSESDATAAPSARRLPIVIRTFPVRPDIRAERWRCAEAAAGELGPALPLTASPLTVGRTLG